MPINAVCPDCNAAYLLADQQAGKKVRCRHCGAVFVVLAMEPPGMPQEPLDIEIVAEPPPLRSAAPPPRSGPPSSRSAPPPRSGPPSSRSTMQRPRDVEPLPPHRPAARGASRRGRDDYDEYDGIHAGAGNRKTMAIVILVIGGLILIGGGIGLAVALSGSSDQQAALNNPPPPPPVRPLPVPPARPIPPPPPPPPVLPPPPPPRTEDEEPTPPPPPPKTAKKPPVTAKEPDDPPVKKPDDPPVKKPDDPPVKSPDDPPVKKPDDAPLASGELPRDARKRVKAATVYIKVTMADGAQASGTGFFGVPESPNLVMTNAHVVGMLSPDSKPPKNIEVRIHSGQDEEQRLSGRVLGVDRSADLAVLEVDRNTGLPPALVVKSAKELEELDKLYTFGFPLGESLGKEITIRPTSVSSLRKKHGALDRIQVNGGMDPGNSGGPVVDTRGFVVGVAVAGIPGRLINFAIPGDYVHSVLNGRLAELGTRLPHLADDGQVVVPVTLVMIDPRSLIKEVALDVWSGDAPADGKAVLPPSDRAAPTRTTDTEHLHYILPYNNGIAKGDVALPALPEGKVYWMQPNWVNAAGKGRWSMGHVWRLSGQPVERKPALLQTRYVPNTIRPLTMKATTTFRMVEGDDEEDDVYQLRMTVGFKELVASAGPAGTTLKFQYSDVKSEIVEDKKVQIDPDLEKVRPLLPHTIAVLKMDALGQVRDNSLDPGFLTAVFRAQGQPGVDLITDFHEPIKHALEALSVPLPNREVKPLEKWTSIRPLPIRSPGRFTKGQVNITYTYLGMRNRNGKNEAVIEINGVVTGKDKTKVFEGKAEGLALVDLVSGQVSLTTTTVKMDVEVNVMVPGSGKKTLRMMSTLSARLERGGL